jgi:5-methylcytosine-specific restriction endonuclease McrA
VCTIVDTVATQHFPSGTRLVWRRGLQRKRARMPVTAAVRKSGRHSPADWAAYEATTERARTPDGYLVCERCGRSLLDRQAQRHHVIFRSHGGPTEERNLLVLCVRCHAAAHGIRVRSST